ncbi:hypothetical protein [Sedimentitalea sp.]|uniref:hypothetical protein n=1 Tax=Sedimentitalea sp. TaxID=2048915 RepID=UPI003297C681
MENPVDTPKHQAGANPSHDEIRLELERILSHPDFGGSERRRDFLRFVVEEALAGRARSLKGFTIALAVFGRDESFDSKTDPVVRLEARRLRQDLDSYYVGPGAADPVRINIPKGGYAPHFEARNPVPEPVVDDGADLLDPTPPPVAVSERRPILTIVAAGFVVLIVALGGVWLGSRDDDGALATSETDNLPRVAILPFEALDDSQTTRTLTLGLSSELILNLRGFDNLRLFAPFAARDLKDKLAFYSNDGIPTYVVHGTVLTESDQVSASVQLLSGDTDELVWGASYDLELAPDAIMALRDTVSAEIAAVIGQPYGPLNNDIRTRGGAHPASLDSYLCVLQAYAYRRSFAEAEFDSVRHCLEASVTQNPKYADAWAMLGWLHLDAVRHGFVSPEQIEAESKAALDAAEHAHALAPENTLALKALSSIHHYAGNYEDAERFGRMALDLNPHDPDTLAQVGWRLSARGNYDEGGPLMERAIQRTVDPPGWYYHLPSLQSFMQGDYERAINEAEIAAAKGTEFAWFLVAINAAALGQTDKAAMALEALATRPRIAMDPEGFMRRHGASDAIISKTMSEYREAQDLVSGRNSPGATINH